MTARKEFTRNSFQHQAGRECKGTATQEWIVVKDLTCPEVSKSLCLALSSDWVRSLLQCPSLKCIIRFHDPGDDGSYFFSMHSLRVQAWSFIDCFHVEEKESCCSLLCHS